jgi:hypothetical protein
VGSHHAQELRHDYLFAAFLLVLHARAKDMTKPRPALNWIKSNPLTAIAGAITTVFGVIAGAANVGPIVLKAFNLPDCYAYAEVYRSPISSFKQEGDFWREYPAEGSRALFEFREVHRTRDNIDLLNLTERPADARWASMIVRLPVCGGSAYLSYPPMDEWHYLFQVLPD